MLRYQCAPSIVFGLSELSNCWIQAIDLEK
jgi:hypothetical protein